MRSVSGETSVSDRADRAHSGGVVEEGVTMVVLVEGGTVDVDEGCTVMVVVL